MPMPTIPMAAAGLLLCALAFVPGRRGRLPCFARGVGMLALVALPVGLAQFLWVIDGARGGDFPMLVFGPFVAVPFNLGGMLAAAAFESIASAGLLEHRQSTVMDNLGVYYPLVAFQASIAAGVIAARTRATGRILLDRIILVVLGAVLANSVLGITWPWWGS